MVTRKIVPLDNTLLYSQTKRGHNNTLVVCGGEG